MINDIKDVDKLKDFERAEFYKKLYEQSMKSRATAIIVFSILSFAIGYLIAIDFFKI